MRVFLACTLLLSACGEPSPSGVEYGEFISATRTICQAAYNPTESDPRRMREFISTEGTARRFSLAQMQQLHDTCEFYRWGTDRGLSMTMGGYLYRQRVHREEMAEPSRPVQTYPAGMLEGIYEEPDYDLAGS